MAKRDYNWEGKDERAATAKLHTAEMKIKYPKEISESFKKTKIYDINFSLPASTGMPLEVIVEDLDSVSAIFNYWKENEKIAVLNFSLCTNGYILKSVIAEYILVNIEIFFCFSKKPFKI